jgi:hypothetical protein
MLWGGVLRSKKPKLGRATAAGLTQELNGAYGFQCRFGSLVQQNQTGRNKMPRGGFREGGGRPKGSKDKFPRRRSDRATKNAAAAPVPPKLRLAPAQISAHPNLPQMSPLEYWLAIMRDENASPERRDRAAALAAPFCHPRMYDARYGKNDERRDRAMRARGGKFAAPPPPPVVGLTLVPRPDGDDE